MINSNLSEVNNLLSSIDRTANLEIKELAVIKNKKSGYQYLFLFIPFSNVIITNLDEMLLKSSILQLALKGYKIDDSYNPKSPQFTIKLLDLRLNAFDFIFIRKISAHVKIKLTYQENNSSFLYTEILDGSSSSYRPYGFERHLIFELEKAFSKAWENSTLKLK
jgi:hypothetical protein